MNFLRKLCDTVKNVLTLPKSSVPRQNWFKRLTLGTGPECDRCGKPTGKPSLYRMPHSHWRCEPCEREVTDILLGLAREGRLTERQARYARPFPGDD